MISPLEYAKAMLSWKVEHCKRKAEFFMARARAYEKASKEDNILNMAKTLSELTTDKDAECDSGLLLAMSQERS